MWIAKFCLIVIIDNTIAIYIHKLQVTWLDTGTLLRVSGIALAVFVKVSLNVCLILHHTFCLVAPEVADRMTFLETSHITGILSQEVITTIVVCLVRLHLCHLVVVVSHIPTYVVLEVLTNLIVPRKRKLNTLVLYSTSILHLGRETCCWIYRNRNQQVLGLLVIPIQGEAQASTQEASIQTDVQLLRSLPSQIFIRQTGRSSTGNILVRITIEGIIATCIKCESTLPLEVVNGLCITILTPTSTKLQEVEP